MTRRDGAALPIGRRRSGVWLHRFAIFVSAATFFLIFAGGLVTSTESGLAVPDWPLSFGQFFPKMEGGVFYEHGHRMVAASVGILAIVLFVWSLLGGERRSVRILSGVALGSVILQGLLGGLTVLLKLPPAISVSHACLAQAFLCVTVALAGMTGRGWVDARADRPAIVDRARIPVRWLAGATCAAVYGQLILGAVMRHTKAGLAIPTFPLAFGRIWPPLPNAAVRINFAHRLWAVVVMVLVAWLFVRIVRSHRDEPMLVRPAFLLAALTAVQVTLGGITILTARAVTPTTFHVLCGAMVLGCSFLIVMRAHRLSGRGSGVAEDAMEAGPGRRRAGELAGGMPA
jgi:cytochrome c oxidase assembly protein subunit 15